MEIPIIYFMHCIFDAYADDIKNLVDRWTSPMRSWNNFHLRPYQRIGNKVAWWYKPDSPKSIDNTIYYSDVDVLPLNDSGRPTEVKIVVTLYPELISLFETLAKLLWSKYPVLDEELKLPQLDQDLWFKSAVDYAIHEAESIRDFERVFGEKETISKQEENPLDVLHVSAKMKRFYPSYNVETAKTIVNAIPEAWNLYNKEGGRWGPGVIGKVAHVNGATVSRYLRAFWLAGVTEIEQKGITIPIPYKSKI